MLAKANLGESLLIERIIELAQAASGIDAVAERCRRACVEAVDLFYQKASHPDKVYHRGVLEAVLRQVNINLDQVCDSLKNTD